ncbi:hypothetical protein [Nonlabens agnitus]|uniref:hypothetical protein n=1 Tax=Nonlabens agnitus TaxID=870484 RepID=UPI001558844B|nr:hypothetical protein [Nonlabens agnitus]
MYRTNVGKYKKTIGISRINTFSYATVFFKMEKISLSRKRNYYSPYHVKVN